MVPPHCVVTAGVTVGVAGVGETFITAVLEQRPLVAVTVNVEAVLVVPGVKVAFWPGLVMLAPLTPLPIVTDQTAPVTVPFKATVPEGRHIEAGGLVMVFWLSTCITAVCAVQTPLVAVTVTFWLAVGAVIAGGANVLLIPGDDIEPAVLVHTTPFIFPSKTAVPELQTSVGAVVILLGLSTLIEPVAVHAPFTAVTVMVWFWVGAVIEAGVKVVEVPPPTLTPPTGLTLQMEEYVAKKVAVELEQTPVGMVNTGLPSTVTVKV
jgi:hypothetical protein